VTVPKRPANFVRGAFGCNPLTSNLEPGHSRPLCLFSCWKLFASVNPKKLKLHPTDMHVRVILLTLMVSALPLFFTGCNACSSRPSNPDQVREKTAEATAELKDNAKAVAQGLKEGLTRPSSDKPIDLNRASKSQLMSLPGVDEAAADRVIAGRPYASEHELLEKRIISRDEYNKIADSITVKK